MSLFTKPAYTIGQIIGNYRKGIADAFSLSGPRPSVGDESAYMDPYRWGSYLLDGKKPSTKAGFIDSNEGWVYICVKLNFQSVGSQALKLYVAKESKGKQYRTIKTKPVDRNKLKQLSSVASLDPWLTKAQEIEEVTDHIYLDLMREVNPYHNARDLKEFTTMFADLTGECYWFLLKDKFKVPKQIYIIPSQYINPIFGETLDKAIKGYLYRRGNVEVKLKPEDVVMFAYPNPNNTFTGFSCIRGVADAVYIQSQMNAFETAVFENRASIGGVFTQSENISKPERERLKKQYEQKHKSARQAGKDMWLPKGMDYKRSAMTPEELNFIEGRKINREEICTALDVPFGMFDPHSNRAVAEAAGYQHAKIGIKPRCDRFAEKINEKILPLFDEKLFCMFDDPVPQNRELILKEQVGRVKVGIVTINEAREELGLEPIEGLDIPWLDNRLMPITAGATAEQVEQIIASATPKAMQKLREMLK